MTSTALWSVAPGKAELRPGAPGEGVAVDMLFSGISRGTERLVLDGRVPDSEHVRMRAPHQEGAFPFPVKYGYCAVGRIAEGKRAGEVVFALHPHQTSFRVAGDMLAAVPDAVPAGRAVLAANMETALNVLWDSGAGAGDRIAVVGAGVVGLLTGYLAAQLPGAEVTLIDTNPDRAEIAGRLGCAFASASGAPPDQDTVIHFSASSDGLATAIACAAPEAVIVEASWYGAGDVPAPLGGAFHSRRLSLVSSQVGQLPPSRRPRWTHARRLAKALALLADDRLDALISGETAFSDLPEQYGAILSDPSTLCHRIRYT